MFNLLYNFLVNLINKNDGKGIQVSVVGHRFSRENMGLNNIKVVIVDSSGRTIEHVVPYCMIGSNDLKMKNVLSYLPLSRKMVNKLLSSVNFRTIGAKFIRYDVESGSAIINVPNNPSNNVAFVTRNMSTRMSENISLDVGNLNAYFLLLLLARCGDLICHDIVLCNFFFMHFINNVVNDNSINFFNCNFEMKFEFSIGKTKIVKNDILPVTAVNYSGNFDIDDSINFDFCEAFLLMTVGNRSLNVDDIYVNVDSSDYMIFNNLHSDEWAYTIVNNVDFDDNINRVHLSDFRILSLIKRYFGKFFPAFVNSIVLSDDFVSVGNGVKTGEIYNSDLK